MIHSKTSPYIELENKKISISKAAYKTIEFFRELAHTEPKFDKIKIVSEVNSLFDYIEIEQTNAAELLAEEILNQNIKEIRKKDDSKIIDLEYTDAEILSYSLTSEYREDESIICMPFTFTTSKWLRSSIGCIVAHHNYFSHKNNCIDFIKASIKIFNPSYVTIRPTNDREFTKALKKYKHNSKFGIYTYFNRNTGFTLPTEISNVSIEEMPEGKLFKLDSFHNLDKAKSDILNIMKSFEKVDPRVLKEAKARL